MENRFIREINVDWRQIDKNSYLHQIPAIRSLHNIVFDDNITLFREKTERGRLLYYRRLPLVLG